MQYSGMLRTSKRSTVLLLLLFQYSCGERTCSSSALVTCTEGRTDILFTNGQLINLHNPEQNCRDIYPQVSRCFREVLQACGSSITNIIVAAGAGAGISLLQYVCSDTVIQEYSIHGRCLEHPTTTAPIYMCGYQFQNESRQSFYGGGDLCGPVQRFRACLAVNVNASCGEEAVRFVDELLAVSAESALAVFAPTCDVRAPLDKYCFPSPCQNGGQCNSLAGEPNCDCPLGYNGTYCDISNSSKPDCQGPRCTNVSDDQEPEETSPVGLSVPVIVGIVVGVLAALILIGCSAAVIRRHYRISALKNNDTSRVQNPTRNQVSGHQANIPSYISSGESSVNSDYMSITNGNQRSFSDQQANNPHNISSEYLDVYGGSSINSDYLSVTGGSVGTGYSYVNPQPGPA